jgi:preprotein translocase subunit SecG
MLVVLLQAGRGGGIGLAFGSGGSQSVFGSSGGATFLTKLTATCAIIFFANSLALAYLSSQSDSRRLQKIAEKNALTKKAEEAANSKILTDIDKQRAEKAKAEAAKSEATPGSAPAEEAAEETADKPSTELKLALPDKTKPVGKLSPDLKLGKLDKLVAEKPVEKPVGEKKAVAVEPAPKKKAPADKAAAEKSAEDRAVAEDKPAPEKKVAKKAAVEKKAEENAEEKPAAE